ncbi:MAG: M14 family zinc carboxypeptidase [Bacteroidia bacterium]
MLRLLTAFSLFIFLAPTFPAEISDDWLTPYERSGKVATATWADAISYYQRLAAENKQVKLREIGLADVGRPIHFVTISNSEVQDGADARAQGKRVLFINNAIHPGEPCGVDASMMLARDILYKPGMLRFLDHGHLHHSDVQCGWRAEPRLLLACQPAGPQAYGFRQRPQPGPQPRLVKCDSRVRWHSARFSAVASRYLYRHPHHQRRGLSGAYHLYSHHAPKGASRYGRAYARRADANHHQRP